MKRRHPHPHADDAARMLEREVWLLEFEKKIEAIAMSFAKRVARAVVREVNLSTMERRKNRKRR